MQETVRLFDKDAYAVTFEAVVLSVRELDRCVFEVVLDRTLFFPEEGGQTPDTGVIEGLPVVDVQMKDGVIFHYVRTLPDESEKGRPEKAAPGISAAGKETLEKGEAEESAQNLPVLPGRTVQGRIDFSHRFSNMQNHSGEHILSGLVHGRFGYDNVGFHLSDNTVTLDFNGPLTDEDILWLENSANRVVWDNLEIRAWYPDEEELAVIKYRSKKEIDGPLRLVEISGVDVCACCAPHVRRTGEIGLVKIVRTLRERGGIRLTILCGSRALAYIQTMQRAAEEVSHLTNMPREEIAAGVSRVLSDNDRLRQREAALEEMYTQALADGVPKDQEDVFLFVNGIGNLAQRRLVNTLCKTHSGYCGVFAGTDGEGYKYILGAGCGTDVAGAWPDRPKEKVSDKTCADRQQDMPQTREGARDNRADKVSDVRRRNDARVLNACLHKACGARGGGKPAMVQGSVRSTEKEIREALEKALYEPAQV